VPVGAWAAPVGATAVPVGATAVTAEAAPATAGPEWAPERLVSAVEAARLVAAQFPELRSAAVRPLATGWDNTVYLVGEHWLFRFPRREIALPGVHQEIDVLPRIAPHVPLSIPVPRFVGAPTDSFPWPFWGARHLAGQELADAPLADDARIPVAIQVGEFLRALHAPALVSLAGADLPHDPMSRAEPPRRSGKTRAALARLAARGLWRPDPAVDRLLAQTDLLGPAPGPAAVAHGDLHHRHLLVAADGRAAGVIDWGDLCLADPAVDLSLAYSAFDGAARAALLDAYGPVDAERELRARALALCLSAILADYGDAEGRASLLAESLAGIGRSVAD
jgi:aminoglycoside phosphotransferase (APT) family kinase protein